MPDNSQDYCVGPRCRGDGHAPRQFVYRSIRRPVIESNLLTKTFTWKMGARFPRGDKSGPPVYNVQRMVAFPQAFGLSSRGTWRWPFPGIAFTLGSDFEKSDGTKSSDKKQWKGFDLSPSVAFRLTRKLGGSLGIEGEGTIFPSKSISLKRAIPAGPVGSIVARGTYVHPEQGSASGAKYLFTCEWLPNNSSRVMPRQLDGKFQAKVEKAIDIGRTTALSLGTTLENPGAFTDMRPGNLKPQEIEIGLVRSGREKSLAHLARTAGVLTTFNKTGYGKRREIGVVAGHWIDPWDEPGAPGEREFNMMIANRAAAALKTAGWRVLRPDRDAPGLLWDDYLDWISTQSRRGVPVVEIHGQGKAADYRGIVLGVIGTRTAPLNQELAADFGFFPMDWRELAVPRRGGTILESFNSDEVLRQNKRQRSAYADRLADRLVGSVEHVDQRLRKIATGGVRPIAQGCSATGCADQGERR